MSSDDSTMYHDLQKVMRIIDTATMPHELIIATAMLKLLAKKWNLNIVSSMSYRKKIVEGGNPILAAIQDQINYKTGIMFAEMNEV